jgi:hypothetical protein
MRKLSKSTGCNKMPTFSTWHRLPTKFTRRISCAAIQFFTTKCSHGRWSWNISTCSSHFCFNYPFNKWWRLRFSTSCQHSCHYVQPQYAHMHSCHNGERSSMYRLTSLFSYHHDYFICMKLETSPKKVRRFFLNFCRFGRSSVLERLLELVRLWKATASLDFTVGFCCFSSNSWTSLCGGERERYDENT